MSASIIRVALILLAMKDHDFLMSEPLTIFVYEHLTSGAYSDLPIDSSLVVEGRAMVDAIIADFASLPNVSVITMRRDGILELQMDGVTTHTVHSYDEATAIYQHCCTVANRLLIIAPESDGVLQEVLIETRQHRPFVTINCFDRALQIGCDKWELAKFCQEAEIRHIPTALWMGQGVECSYPAIIKPRDGAGCEGVIVVHADSVASDIMTDGSLIVQPLFRGVSLSSAACFSSTGECLLTLPLGAQHINIADTVEYQGGTIPWRNEFSTEANRQANEIWASLERQLVGLWGYVSIDWIWEAEAKTLQLVELNPRLTTSYVGYRQLFGHEITKAMLEMPCEIDTRELAQVSFTVDGVLNCSGSMTTRQP